MSVQEIESAIQNFIKQTGTPPAPHEEPTGDQYSAVRALLQEGGPPYVDMTLWTPYNLRLQRRMATS
eukprot:3828605-Amphidinium_carterae.1